MCSFNYRKHKVFTLKKEKQTKQNNERKGNAQNEVFARQSVTHVRFITDESFAKIRNQFFIVAHKRRNWAHHNRS